MDEGAAAVTCSPSPRIAAAHPPPSSCALAPTTPRPEEPAPEAHARRRAPLTRSVVLIDVRDWRGPRCSCGMVLLGSIHARGRCVWCAVDEERRRVAHGAGAKALVEALAGVTVPCERSSVEGAA